MQLMRTLDARSQNGMALGRVAADDDDEARLLDVLDGAGIAAVAHGAEKPGGRGRLAIARTVIHIVGPDHRARQLLHQVAFLVRALRRRDERERIGTIRAFDLGEAARHQVESLIPRRFSEFVVFTNQRLGQAIGTVDIVPPELALDAGRNAVGGTVKRLDFEDLTLFRPNVERAAHTAVGAHGLRPLDLRFAHVGFNFRELHDRAITHLRLHAFDDVDHALQRIVRQTGKVAGLAEHRLLHERIARADSDAVATGNTTRLADRARHHPTARADAGLPSGC